MVTMVMMHFEQMFNFSQDKCSIAFIIPSPFFLPKGVCVCETERDREREGGRKEREREGREGGSLGEREGDRNVALGIFRTNQKILLGTRLKHLQMPQVFYYTLELLGKLCSAPTLRGSDSAGLQRVGPPSGLRGSPVAPGPAS